MYHTADRNVVGKQATICRSGICCCPGLLTPCCHVAVRLPFNMRLQRTVTAMAKVGIPAEQREAVFATVAAVLHLGNISFVEGSDQDSSKVAPGAALEHLKAAGQPQHLHC